LNSVLGNSLPSWHALCPSRPVIEISARLQPPLSHLAIPQVVEVHHLNIDLSACGDEVRRIAESNGEPILFGDNVLNFVDGIGAGLCVPV
jgi:hypothetical protein